MSRLILVLLISTFLSTLVINPVYYFSLGRSPTFQAHRGSGRDINLLLV